MIEESPPTSHQQLRSWVVNQIRDAILQGDLEPGEWLRQERLAQQLGVSQMPIREALKQLTAEGLIEHIPYRGARVIAFSPEDVEDLYAHRSFLEGRTARLAAQNISDEGLAELRDLLEQIKACMEPEDLPAYRELNRQFHNRIIEASGREYLQRTLRQMWQVFPNMLWNTFAVTSTRSLPERDATDLGEHEAIVAALSARDPETAERLMRAHIAAAGHELVSRLRSAS